MTLTATDVGVWHAVCRLDELEPEWGEAALLDGQQIAVFLRGDGSVHAVSNRDPATGSFVMARGIVGSRGDRPTIASPLHKQVYDLVTGQGLSHPELCLPVHRARVLHSAVEISLDAG